MSNKSRLWQGSLLLEEFFIRSILGILEVTVLTNNLKDGVVPGSRLIPFIRNEIMVNEFNFFFQRVKVLLVDPSVSSLSFSLVSQRVSWLISILLVVNDHKRTLHLK